MKRVAFSFFVAVSLLFGSANDTLQESGDVLERFLSIPEESIPLELLNDAKAIAVFPNVIRAGFLVGARYGKGVLFLKENRGGWSCPLFVTLKGGSLGWQIGAQSIEIVLVFKTRERIDDLLKGKITLGGDASVAAGPVGRNAQAATDLKMRSEIFSYSRSRGLYLGLSLAGSILEPDWELMREFYKSENLDPNFCNEKKSDPEIKKIQELLYQYVR